MNRKKISIEKTIDGEGMAVTTRQPRAFSAVSAASKARHQNALSDKGAFANGRVPVTLLLPRGESDSRILRQLIDDWVAPILAGIYLDERHQSPVSKQRSRQAVKGVGHNV